MEKLKDKYEILIGFITIVISFSAFKDELKAITIDLGFVDFNLSQYFFVIVIGFLFSIYLYTVESVLNKTRLGNWKGFNYVILIAYTIFVLILFSPFIIGLSYLGKNLINSIGNLRGTSNILSVIISIILTLISSFFSGYFSHRVLKARKDKAIEELEEEEIKDLDTARKLYTDGYFSQSILEAFKVLEVHLYRMISKSDLRVRRFHFQDLIEGAMKLEVIEEKDIPFIQDIRGMRNSAAHRDVAFTKEQAEKTIDFISDLIEKSGSKKH
ncbi:hypothetical protein PbJCM13498_20440 [Prolixibacter bellariivorans]|uniref:Uncharacterized protein n=1 Tax=Prolixibacter bellariivorans TaxID=314319 RepID=A0A5M4AZV7_9BACT|nr:hypothetical protein [Prolixibacter bellariivorans]GET33181.1 hypothetical protein PbJCM13498_20440 [Prolixibacter bellariivorans]